MSTNRRPPFPWPLLRFWTLRILPAWFLIALVIFLFQLAICGIVHDNERVKALIQYIDMLPAFLKTFIGGEAVQYGNIAGLISIGYQDPFVLLLYMLFAVGVPTALLAGEVQRGTMELILSRQTTKIQVYICAGLITIAGMYALVVVMFLGTVVSTNLYDFEQQIPLYNFFKLAVNDSFQIIRAAIFEEQKLLRNYLTVLGNSVIPISIFIQCSMNFFEDVSDAKDLAHR